MLRQPASSTLLKVEIISGSQGMRSSFDENDPKPGSALSNYLFIRPLLRRLGDGAFVYKIATVTLRMCAGLVVLGSLASFFKAGKTIFDLPTTGAIFGGILFQIFYIMAIYSVVHILIIRAKDIDDSKPGPIFMLPLGAMLVRLAGEAYAAFVTLIAIGGGLFVWFTSQNVASILGPMSQLFPVKRNVDFIAGIEFMISGVLIGIAALMVSYMVAEAITLLVKKEDKAAGTNGSNGSGPRPLPNRSTINSRFGS
ncbi:MAG: hypothetical protein OEY67_11005 [Gammaproteobacteria bacterium]|nr:hypothetical protein [Gammaproteobacteria bacterium]